MTLLDPQCVNQLKEPHYRQCQTYLQDQPKFGKGTGLYRMTQVLEQIPASQAWDAIKITGSNGKGSTLAMLSAIFSALGLNHGSFSSPHLVRINERICVDGQPISSCDLGRGIAWIKTMIADHSRLWPEDSFGGFEILTGIALHHFAQKKLPHLILEAGIGGRFDSTRPVPGRLVGLTSLDLEHTDLLGNSLLAIARDKMELCPPNGTLVLNHLGDEAPLKEIRAYAELLGIHLLEVAKECQVSEVNNHSDHTRLTLTVRGITFRDLTLNLLGPHQMENAQLAVLLTLEYLTRRKIPFTCPQITTAVAEGLAGVSWLGRAQKVNDHPTIYLDVGHTPKAIASFLATLPELVGEAPILLVTGVSHNKPVELIVAQLLPIASQAIFTRAYHMGTELTRIEKVARALHPELPYQCADSIEIAVKMALQKGRAKKMTVVVAGGLFLAIEFLMALEGHDPQLLHFF